MTDTTESHDPFGPPPEPPHPQPLPPATAPDFTSLSPYKIMLIGGLAIATVLPNLFISNLIEERETRQDGVRAGVHPQLGAGAEPLQPDAGHSVPGRRPPAPIRQDRAGAARPQRHAQRRRSASAACSSATVYDAKVDMSGAFVVPAEARLRDFVADKDGRFIWNEAAIAFGAVSNLTGLRSTDNITIDGTEQQWMPCLEALRQEAACRGAALVLANAPLTPALDRQHARAVQVRREPARHRLVHGAVRRQGACGDLPLAWPSPSFGGNTLPLELQHLGRRLRGELADDRVRLAAHHRLHSRSMDPAMWKGATIAVDLIEATPIYRMITRVAKYGLLFVVLSFATYFFFEVLSRLQIHIVQYGLLGLSLSLFSLLLLSLAEPIGYTNGYLVSAGLVLTQSTLYTAAVARRFKPAFLFAVMLSSLFGFLYVLLGLETYSLLIGALALFVVVSALMVLTQMVRWPGRPEPAVEIA